VRSETGITFQHPAAFWAGTAAVVTGVALHIPMFMAAAPMGYHMRGMPLTSMMLIGMGLIFTGLSLAAYGLIPFGDAARSSAPTKMKGVHFRAMDGAHLTRQHWGLLFVLGIALIVDVMKPATLGFVVPGMKAEYGMAPGVVALFPLTALTGSTIGSLLWGVLTALDGAHPSCSHPSCSWQHRSVASCLRSGGTCSCASSWVSPPVACYQSCMPS